MNNTDDRITRVLQQQANRIHGGPLTMPDVTGKARSIRRRRALAATAGAAAVVVAIIAPVGIIAMNNGDKQPLNPTSSGPTAASSAPAPNGQVFTVDMTPPAEGTTEASPMVPNWFDGTLIDGHGNSVNVGERVTDFIQTGDTWTGVVRTDDGPK